DFEKGATQKEQVQALATVINDANIGIGVYAKDDGSFDVATALSSGSDAGQVETFTFGSGANLTAASGAAAQTGTIALTANTDSNKVADIDLGTVLGAQTAVITID